MDPFFLLENPQDPMDYMPEEAEKEEYPSYWAFEEVAEAAELMKASFVKFDQGQHRKPTALMIGNAPGLDQLNGISGEGPGNIIPG